MRVAKAEIMAVSNEGHLFQLNLAFCRILFASSIVSLIVHAAKLTWKRKMWRRK